MSLVSVIIPCYNVERYVGECLDSVIQQTYKDLEIICVDDGSSDGTVRVLRSYESRYNNIKVICTENKGAPAARNLGLQLSKGSFIQFMDADDVMHPEKIAKQIAAFDPAVDVVVSDRIQKDEKLEQELARFTFEDIEANPLSVAIRKIIITSNPLYRKEVVAKLGGYTLHMAGAQDWEFHLRLVLEGFTIRYLPGFYFISRKVGNSVSSNWIKICFLACDVVKHLKNKIVASTFINDDIRWYISGLYYEAAIRSSNKKKTKQYLEELRFWSSGKTDFVQNSIKRSIGALLGINTLVKLQRVSRPKFDFSFPQYGAAH